MLPLCLRNFARVIHLCAYLAQRIAYDYARKTQAGPCARRSQYGIGSPAIATKKRRPTMAQCAGLYDDGANMANMGVCQVPANNAWSSIRGIPTVNRTMNAQRNPGALWRDFRLIRYHGVPGRLNTLHRIVRSLTRFRPKHCISVQWKWFHPIPSATYEIVLYRTLNFLKFLLYRHLDFLKFLPYRSSDFLKFAI